MAWDDEEKKIEELVGKTLTSINGDVGSDTIDFTTSEGDVYRMYHGQVCCEEVYVDDIVGDLYDLIGSPILIAREDNGGYELGGSKSEDGSDYEGASYTWTFYNLATIRGSVTIKWYGSSNGYYSESVGFIKLKG